MDNMVAFLLGNVHVWFLAFRTLWRPKGMQLLLLSRFSRVRLCATPWTAAYLCPWNSKLVSPYNRHYK